MTYLSDKTIREKCEAGILKISPFNPSKLSPNGYDLKVSVVDGEGNLVKGEGEYTILPNELIRVKTIEEVGFPNGYIGQMYLRSRYTRQGLLGLFAVIDSGFNGVLYATIKNLNNKPMVINLNDGVIHLLISNLTTPSDVPYGANKKSSFQNQK